MVTAADDPHEPERAAPRPRVVTVILSHDSVATLRQTVSRVTAQTAAVGRVVVVDNGSTDGTVEYLRSLGDSVTSLELAENLGVGAGHNRGWSLALEDVTTDLLWVLEHDTWPEPDCLARLIETRAEFGRRGVRVGAVVPRQTLPSDPHELPGRTEPWLHPRLTFNGVLLTKVAVLEVGFLREDFFVGHEDREYAVRLLRAGFAIVKDPHAVVEHRHRGVSTGARPGIVRSFYGVRNDAYLRVHVLGERWGRFRVVARSLAAAVRTVLLEDRKRARLRARLRATVEGLRGDLGRRDEIFT